MSIDRRDDAPVRTFVERLTAALDPGPDMAAIGRALQDLAADRDYFDPLIEVIDEEAGGGAGLYVPEQGPRLFLLHRPRGVMSYVHSHSVFVGLAPVRGVETHRRYEVESLTPPDRAVIRVAEELALKPGDVATLLPPDDIHSHGHAGGPEETPYSLILTGDDQTRFARREYDIEAGTYRDLPVGEFGTLNLPTVP